jgi:FlaA1/EpsC-like NDP-sugar epimerase
MDNSEYNCYRAEEKIQKLFPNLNLNCIVADACNEALSRMIFNQYRPRIVFHAAAYKHVPLMEFNPWAAIYNNLKSTLLLTQLSEEFGVDKFVLVSTDKAVQPTSVMGATKRICELIALHQSENGGPKCITVRFGNVMGSSGSVIYKFKKQIEQGESLTVTHPDITRYFMLISEAVELVLQAGAIGKNGNIYILDMGDPIKIVDLAKYMVELSGLKLNEDIKITYTGLRPGEKLHENLLLEGKEKKTEVPNLFVLEQKSLIGPDYFKKVHSLLNNLYQMDHRELRLKLKELVPEYQPNLDIHSALNNNHEPEYDLNMETVV